MWVCWARSAWAWCSCITKFTWAISSWGVRASWTSSNLMNTSSSKGSSRYCLASSFSITWDCIVSIWTSSCRIGGTFFPLWTRHTLSCSIWSCLIWRNTSCWCIYRIRTSLTWRALLARSTIIWWDATNLTKDWLSICCRTTVTRRASLACYRSLEGVGTSGGTRTSCSWFRTLVSCLTDLTISLLI